MFLFLFCFLPHLHSHWVLLFSLTMLLDRKCVYKSHLMAMNSHNLSRFPSNNISLFHWTKFIRFNSLHQAAVQPFETCWWSWNFSHCSTLSGSTGRLKQKLLFACGQFWWMISCHWSSKPPTQPGVPLWMHDSHWCRVAANASLCPQESQLELSLSSWSLFSQNLLYGPSCCPKRAMFSMMMVCAWRAK